MPITAIYVALSGLLLWALSYRVVRLRGRHKVSLGDGGVVELARAIRAQGNFAEYVPLVLFLIILVEIAEYPPALVHLLGGALVLGRILHGVALGFTAGWRFGRFWGVFLTWSTLLLGSLLTGYAAVADLIG
jgi:uncharacterized membrane protein YecN with MAPEG domain